MLTCFGLFGLSFFVSLLVGRWLHHVQSDYPVAPAPSPTLADLGDELCETCGSDPSACFYLCRPMTTTSPSATSATCIHHYRF